MGNDPLQRRQFRALVAELRGRGGDCNRREWLKAGGAIFLALAASVVWARPKPKAEARSRIVRTVTGDISPSDLGVTLPHEHLLVQHVGWRRDSILDDLDLAQRELDLFAQYPFNKIQARTVVELTSHGVRGLSHAERLRMVAEKTGVRIVMATGFHKKAWHPHQLTQKTQQQLEELLVADIVDGVGSLRIKAGVIGEIGISGAGPAIDDIDPDEFKVLKAAAATQRRTGAALYLHFDNDWRSPSVNGTLRLAVLQYLSAEESIDLHRVIICHCSPLEADLPLHRRIIETGAYVGFDSWGVDVGCPGIPESDYATYGAAVRELIADESCLQRVLLSQDVCVPRHLTAHGGCGYAHLVRDVVPRFLSYGISEQQIHRMMVGNPQTVLPLAANA
ncbi:MAG: hydrolase [Nitrospira sp.]|nr:MAG: hydrolase [Nitrospira sp.]